MAIAGAARSVTAKCKLTVSVNFAHPPGAAPDLRLRRGSSVASAAAALMFLKCASKRRLKDFSPDNGTATEHDEGDQSLCLSAQLRFGSTQRVRSCPHRLRGESWLPRSCHMCCSCFLGRSSAFDPEWTSRSGLAPRSE